MDWPWCHRHLCLLKTSECQYVKPSRYIVAYNFPPIHLLITPTNPSISSSVFPACTHTLTLSCPLGTVGAMIARTTNPPFWHASASCRGYGVRRERMGDEGEWSSWTCPGFSLRRSWRMWCMRCWRVWRCCIVSIQHVCKPAGDVLVRHGPLTEARRRRG